jgi:LuxR family transcriptional regulator, maltose regulon positive regulatory protein
MAAVRPLLRAFPAAVLADPDLAPVLAAEQLELGTLDEAAAYIAHGERQAASVPTDRRGRFEVALGIARLWLARRRCDVAAALKEVQALRDLSSGDSSIGVAISDERRAVALMQLGIAETWAGRIEDAQRHLDEAQALARRIGRRYIEILCLANAPRSRASTLEEARQHNVGVIRMAEAQGWGTQPIIAVSLARLSLFDAAQGRFDDAERWLERVQQILESDLIPATGILMHHARGMVHVGRRRYDRAEAELRAANRLLSRLITPYMLAGGVRQLLVRTLLLQGENEAARAVLAALSDEERAGGEIRLALAALHLADGETLAAVDTLAPVLSGAASVLRDFTTIQALLLHAAARERLGETPAADAAVERALALAEPDLLTFPFIIECPRELLERHRGTAHAALLADILDVLDGSSTRTRSTEPVDVAVELSESEQRVLSYLPTNLSTQEIAGELYLSSNTVKIHLRSIYRKLGARRRTEAVDRARALGLLRPPARRR